MELNINRQLSKILFLAANRQREHPIQTLYANPPYFQHRGHLFCDVMITPGLPAGGRLVSYVKVISGLRRFRFVLKRVNVFVNFGILLKDE